MNRLEAIDKCAEVVRGSAGKTSSANQDCGIGWCKYVMTTLYEQGFEVRKVRAENADES